MAAAIGVLIFLVVHACQGLPNYPAQYAGGSQNSREGYEIPSGPENCNEEYSQHNLGIPEVNPELQNGVIHGIHPVGLGQEGQQFGQGVAGSSSLLQQHLLPVEPQVLPVTAEHGNNGLSNGRNNILQRIQRGNEEYSQHNLGIPEGNPDLQNGVIHGIHPVGLGQEGQQFGQGVAGSSSLLQQHLLPVEPQVLPVTAEHINNGLRNGPNDILQQIQRGNEEYSLHNLGIPEGNPELQNGVINGIHPVGLGQEGQQFGQGVAGSSNNVFQQHLLPVEPQVLPVTAEHVNNGLRNGPNDILQQIQRGHLGEAAVQPGFSAIHQAVHLAAPLVHQVPTSVAQAISHASSYVARNDLQQYQHGGPAQLYNGNSPQQQQNFEHPNQNLLRSLISSVPNRPGGQNNGNNLNVLRESNHIRENNNNANEILQELQKGNIHPAINYNSASATSNANNNILNSHHEYLRNLQGLGNIENLIEIAKNHGTANKQASINTGLGNLNRYSNGEIEVLDKNKLNFPQNKQLNSILQGYLHGPTSHVINPTQTIYPEGADTLRHLGHGPVVIHPTPIKPTPINNIPSINNNNGPNAESLGQKANTPNENTIPSQAAKNNGKNNVVVSSGQNANTTTASSSPTLYQTSNDDKTDSIKTTPADVSIQITKKQVNSTSQNSESIETTQTANPDTEQDTPSDMKPKDRNDSEESQSSEVAESKPEGENIRAESNSAGGNNKFNESKNDVTPDASNKNPVNDNDDGEEKKTDVTDNVGNANTQTDNTESDESNRDKNKDTKKESSDDNVNNSNTQNGNSEKDDKGTDIQKYNSVNDKGDAEPESDNGENTDTQNSNDKQSKSDQNTDNQKDDSVNDTQNTKTELNESKSNENKITDNKKSNEVNGAKSSSTENKEDIHSQTEQNNSKSDETGDKKKEIDNNKSGKEAKLADNAELVSNKLNSPKSHNHKSRKQNVGHKSHKSASVESQQTGEKTEKQNKKQEDSSDSSETQNESNSEENKQQSHNHKSHANKKKTSHSSSAHSSHESHVAQYHEDAQRTSNEQHSEEEASSSHLERKSEKSSSSHKSHQSSHQYSSSSESDKKHEDSSSLSSSESSQ